MRIKLIDSRKFFLLMLLACAVCQFVITQYFTIFQGQEHLGVDASWNYLKVIMADKHGTLYPKEFMHETTQPEMEKIIFVLPFYKLTGNIWLSFGLANIVLTLVMIFLLWKVMENIGFGIITKAIIINLFLCPYLSNGFSVTNDLGYFSCVLGFSPYQDIPIIEFFLLLWLITLDELDKKTWSVFILTFVSTLYLCLCKGMGDIVWCGIPIIFYILFHVFYYNDKKYFYSWKSLMLWAIFASMIAGRLLGALIGFTYLDSGMNWINASNFWSNIGNIFLGFMALVGAIPGSEVNRDIFEFTGFVYVFGVIIFTVILISFIFCFSKLIKQIKIDHKADKIALFLMTIIIINCLEYTFINTQYSQDIFELRYLLNAALAGFILVGYFIEALKNDLLFKKAGVIILFLSIVAMDLYSDYFLTIADNSSWHVDEVLEVVESTDAELIVFWDSGKEFVKTERVIRVVDTDRVYKSISYGNELEDFGDYNYFDDTTEYEGATILIVNASKPAVFKDVLDHYEEIAVIGDMCIYYSDENYIDIKKQVSNTVSRR